MAEPDHPTRAGYCRRCGHSVLVEYDDAGAATANHPKFGKLTVAKSEQTEGWRERLRLAAEQQHEARR